MHILSGEAEWLPSHNVKLDIVRCPGRIQRHKAFLVASRVAPGREDKKVKRVS